MKVKRAPVVIVFFVLSLFVLLLLVAQQSLKVGRQSVATETTKKKVLDGQGSVLSRVISLGKNEKLNNGSAQGGDMIDELKKESELNKQTVMGAIQEKDLGAKSGQENTKVKKSEQSNKSEQTNKLGLQREVNNEWGAILLNAKSSFPIDSLYSLQKYRAGVDLDLLSWKMISGKTAENVIIGMDLRLSNQTVHNLKDFQIDCLSIGNSGSIIGRHTDVLYETLFAQEQKSFVGVFRIGPVNYQTSKLLCSVIWYEFVS